MRVPAPVKLPLTLIRVPKEGGTFQVVLTSVAWIEWFQRLSDYYEAVSKFIDPKSPFFGQAAPSNPFEGLLAYADGVSWDPEGTGTAGIYLYVGGVWRFSSAILPSTTVMSETTFGGLVAVGASLSYARADHTHGTPTNPVPAHAALTETHGASGNILGATTAAATFAPIAKGVTNGDSHDHSGGDGAQVDHAGLANLTAGDPHTQYQQESEKDSASGYAGLNASSRGTKGIDTTDDLIVDSAPKGLVLKDTQAAPHYWRITISNLGALVITDLGTVKP